VKVGLSGLASLPTKEGEWLDFQVYNIEDKSLHSVEFTWDNSIPDNDGSFTSAGLSVAKSIKAGLSGISIGQTSQVKIFPNPTDGKVNILGINTGSEIAVFDNHGRKTINEYTNDDTMQLDLSWVQEGIYYIRISGSDGISIEKIVVY